MTSFDQWLRNFRLQPVEPEREPELPDGVREVGDGEYEARCFFCEEWKPLYVGLDEIPMVGYEHYCGGSPRCCP